MSSQPLTIYETCLGIFSRGLMSPSSFSSLLMKAILPAQNLVEKREPKITYDSIEVFNDPRNSPKLERPGYLIFFCGQGLDAEYMVDFFSAESLAKNIYRTSFNYPGVGGSAGSSQSVHDLVDAGYKQAKRLLGDNIAADKITLYGHSLGGGVAAQVALRLHQEGHLVNLEINCSFSRISSVVSVILKQPDVERGLAGIIINLPPIKENIFKTPLLTSIMALSVSGLTLGAMMAGLIASIKLIVISFTTPSLAPYIHDTFNFIGTLVGAVTAIVGILIGAAIGAVLGALLSLQYLWQENPFTLPLQPVVSALLHATCCEMDSAHAIRQIIAEDKKPAHAHKIKPFINILNILEDPAIPSSSSLNVGLGFEPEKTFSDKRAKVSRGNITSFWYDMGENHLAPPELDRTTSYVAKI